MRAVAERADVAVGTLYRYFPSKVHLLVSALGREFERIDAKTDRAALSGGTPYQRLSLMVGKLNRAMQRNPLLTEAMTRAFVFADASAAGEVDHVGKLMDSMFARAMSDGEPTEDQYHIARVISDVWLSNLLAWLTRRASATDVSNRLDLAVRLLIGDGELGGQRTLRLAVRVRAQDSGDRVDGRRQNVFLEPVFDETHGCAGSFSYAQSSALRFQT